MEPSLIHADPDFLILSKPAGLLMHGLPNKKAEEPTVTDWLLANYPEVGRVGDDPKLRPGLVHRLDRDTSGILLAARTQDFFSFAKSLFQKRGVRKTYLALVRGGVDRPHNVIRRPIGIRSGTTMRSVRSAHMPKEALTEYGLLEYCVRAADAAETPGFKTSLLRVVPHTGRTHQIRVHLTAIGHPVMGDPLYGPGHQPDWVTRLMLHAFALEFQDARGEHRRFSVFPDDEFQKVLDAAGSSGNWAEKMQGDPA